MDVMKCYDVPFVEPVYYHLVAHTRPLYPISLCGTSRAFVNGNNSA